MQTATVLGSTHATIKHESFVGCRMVILQPLTVDEKPDGPPLIAIDQIGSRRGDKVMISSDGRYAREVTKHDRTPARWTVVGIID
ncbi:EutN/CcmL family microcompartment protein [Stieleria sp. JC731]|uniref:EutN/CcmL family microcompartment protein n=1 Tax=Pirellulaceae TaxID=2691357 RepID=UPI001E54EA11|nr:EutN/CcmL family microcompartment protein [Stieleria sp. JC731]MCC9603874.1 EutN/CcmL family microcompartment protein [Stieleria sp. JC731]